MAAAAVTVKLGGWSSYCYCPTTTRRSKPAAVKMMMAPCPTSFRIELPRRTIRAAILNKRHTVPCYQRQEGASSPAPQIEAKSMEEVYDALAEHLFSVLKNIEHLDSKYIVGIAGPPGAGKSTVASEVVQRVNKRWSQKHENGSSLISTEEIATMLPMDGFHLYRSQLDAMEDPKEAHARRGAPWTFDPSRFLKCLQTLREEVLPVSL
uniref:Phosphoribulokinase/uridine kinase domain-containing protein n=1 Tax=Oryza glaberrima TaxID=4538 RepID=I1R7N2_ORYGL